MREGGGVDQGVTPERGRGETIMVGGAVEEGGMVVGEGGGETEDAVEHHLHPGIEVKDHQRETDDQRPLPCTSKYAV